MERRSGQLWALFIIMTLLVAVVSYQMYTQTQLQTSVTTSQPQQGYPTSGYPPVPAVAPTPATDPDANPPLSSQVIGNGILELRYLIGFGEFVKVDGLQVPQHVQNLTTAVRWINDTNDNLNFTLDDDTSVRTHFVAPQSEGEIILILMVQTSRGLNPVARYVFDVVNPLVIQADFNQDGAWNFQDLVILLQNWDSLQPQSTQIMSVLLSRYET